MTAQLENVVVKVINAVVFAVVVGSLLFVDFTGRGRLWDTIRGVQKAEVALQAPEKANVQQAEGGDRFMVTQQEEPAAEQAPAAQPAQPAQPTASELAAQVPDISGTKARSPRRLTTSLSGLNDPSRQASMQTSASIDGSTYRQQAPAAAQEAPTGSAYTAEMPTDEQAAKAIAARYARTARADMMGRAAGPVYNLKGNKSAPAPSIGELATPGQ